MFINKTDPTNKPLKQSCVSPVFSFFVTCSVTVALLVIQQVCTAAIQGAPQTLMEPKAWFSSASSLANNVAGDVSGAEQEDKKVGPLASLIEKTLSLSTQTGISLTQTTQAVLQGNPKWDHVVEFAKQNLPLEGTLMMKPDGFVYVQVDESYIQKLYPMLDVSRLGFQPTPLRGGSSAGAHISVFYSDEGVIPKAELGKTFHFELTGIVQVSTRDKDWIVLQVQSPELEALRASYGLSPKLHNHEYHISLAIKKR